MANDDATVVVLNCARKNLACRGAILVDEDYQGDIAKVAIASLFVDYLLILAYGCYDDVALV